MTKDFPTYVLIKMLNLDVTRSIGFIFGTGTGRASRYSIYLHYLHLEELTGLGSLLHFHSLLKIS